MTLFTIGWLILMACQPFCGYFMPRDLVNKYIVRLCQYSRVVSDVLFFCTRLYDIRYSYLIQIICTPLYGFKYSEYS